MKLSNCKGFWFQGFFHTFFIRREGARERECVCVCEREGARKRESICVCERSKEESVFLREIKRERERQRSKVGTTHDEVAHLSQVSVDAIQRSHCRPLVVFAMACSAALRGDHSTYNPTVTHRFGIHGGHENCETAVGATSLGATTWEDMEGDLITYPYMAQCMGGGYKATSTCRSLRHPTLHGRELCLMGSASHICLRWQVYLLSVPREQQPGST